MNLEDPIGIIELGNVNLKCLIFQINKNNSSEVLSTAITPSEGIHNDVVVNLTKASNAIRLSIGTAEKKAKISLKKINVVFEQPDFLCTKFSKHKKIDGSKIHRHDIEFLLKEAKKQLILNDKNQSIIHIFNHNYIVDGKIFMEEPIDVFADSLSHEMTFITVPKNNLKNINQVFIDCDIEIERLISHTFTLGVKLLNVRELQLGSALINLGYKKISLGLFKNLALVHSITLPVGINHITKDISKVCYLDQKESESIKLDFALFSQFNKDIDSLLPKKYFINSNYRKIPLKLIHDVIESRISEIIEMINIHTNDQDGSEIVKKNLLIVGGGANILGLIKILNLDIKYEFIETIKLSNKQETQLMSCNSAQNLFVNGCSSEAVAISMEKQKKGIFTRFFQFFN